MKNIRTCELAKLTSVLLLASSIAAQAQEIEDEVIVIGQLEETIPLKLAEYGNRVEIITADDIKLGGYNDLTQALQMRLPGLHLTPKNGAFDYVGCSLQGSRCQDILWLIDGVRINNRLYNSTTPLDTIPSHMVERIEVLYGGQGIFYGTQSVAGVVNIVTKSFSDTSMGSASVGFDGNDGYHVNGEFRSSAGPHQFVFYGSIDKADGFQPFANSDYQPSGTDRDRGYDVFTAGAKYGITISENSRLSAHYHRTENEVEWASPANTSRAYNERDEDLLSVKWDYRLSDNVNLYVKGYYHDWDSYWSSSENELDLNGDLTGNVVVVSDREFWGYEDYGVTAVADVQTEHNFDYTLGYDHQRYSGRDEVLLIDSQTERVNAFFGQVRSSEDLFENSQIALGVRYNKPSGEGDITVWNLSGKHSFTDTLYVRASAGTAFRFPDAWQLYGNDPCCTLGNPDLEGEESQNLNLALGGQLKTMGGLDWEVIGFSREVDNLIGSADGMRVNTDNAVNIDGFELSLSLLISNSWSVGLDYTHTTAKADGSSEQINDVPEDLLKANIAYSGDNVPIEISVAAVFVGDVYDSVSGGIGRVEHGNYTVLDIGAAWYVDDARKHRLGLRLENALDEQYGSSLGRAFRDVDSSSYAYTNLGTPRTLHVNYRYSF
jgi:vitamin B12 transporter